MGLREVRSRSVKKEHLSCCLWIRCPRTESIELRWGEGEERKRNRRGSKPRAVGKDATSEERGETGKSEFSYSYFFFFCEVKES